MRDLRMRSESKYSTRFPDVPVGSGYFMWGVQGWQHWATHPAAESPVLDAIKYWQGMLVVGQCKSRASSTLQETGNRLQGMRETRRISPAMIALKTNARVNQDKHRLVGIILRGLMHQNASRVTAGEVWRWELTSCFIGRLNLTLD